MAKMKNGILDGLSGKIGPVVVYQWKGRYCLRGREVNYKDPQSPKQQERRHLFSVASKLASAMLPAVSIGYRGLAVAGQTTERGCFMRYNKQCFSIVDNAAHIDYPAVKVAQGTLTRVSFDEPLTQEGGSVSVAFRSGDGGQATDYVLLFAYCPAECHGILSLPAERHQRVVVIDLPRFWCSHEVHLYGFTWDRNLSASNSSYIGAINLLQ